MGIQKILFIKLLYAVSIFSTEQQDPRKKVQLMYNEEMLSNDFTTFHPKLYRGDRPHEFEAFLTRTEVFIDKSLFIHYIHQYDVDDNGPLAITAPSKWGKSTLIAMLKFFYSVELDKDCKPVDITRTNAYNFFNHGNFSYNNKIYSYNSPPFLSGKEYEEIREKYLGKQPILVISFFTLFTRQFDIHQCFKSLLLVALSHSGYNLVIHQFCSNFQNIHGQAVPPPLIKQFCCSYNAFFDADVRDSGIINTIVMILYHYFEKQVILVIDEIEHFPKCVYETADLSIGKQNEYIEFYVDILKPVTKVNEYILYTLIVGVFPFTFPGGSVITPKFVRYFSKEMLPFFGLLDSLAMDLFKKAKLNTEREKQMNNSYNHYRCPSCMDISFYNPYSVLLNLHIKYKNPWAEANRQIHFIQKVVENDIRARNDLFLLLQGECLEIDYQEGIVHVPDMKTFVGVDARVFKNYKFNIDFKYHLWHVGYVTISNTEKFYDDKDNTYFKLSRKKKDLKRPIPKTTFCLSIPNEETREVFESLLYLPKALQMEALELFNDIMNDFSLPVSQFGQTLELMLNSIPKTVKHGSEMYYHSFLFSEIIEKFGRLYNYEHIELDHKMKENQVEEPDIVIHNNHVGVIIEVKYNINDKKFNESFDLQVCNYGIKFHQAYEKVKLRLICLRVCENKDETVTVTIKEYEPLKSKEDFNNLETLCNKNKKAYESKPKRSSKNPDTTKLRKNARTTFTMKPSSDIKKLTSETNGRTTFTTKPSPSIKEQTSKITETNDSPTMPASEGKNVESKGTSLPNA